MPSGTDAATLAIPTANRFRNRQGARTCPLVDGSCCSNCILHLVLARRGAATPRSTGLTPDMLTHPQSAMAFRPLSIDVPKRSLWSRGILEFPWRATEPQNHGQAQHVSTSSPEGDGFSAKPRTNVPTSRPKAGSQPQCEKPTGSGQACLQGARIPPPRERGSPLRDSHGQVRMPMNPDGQRRVFCDLKVEIYADFAILPFESRTPAR